MMNDYLAPGGNKFMADCTYIPQADYFDPPFGITLAVDNRLFPDSANKLFKEHGYPYHIGDADILHVFGCTEAWAGDLDCEARALVRKVYKRDFDLLCEKFGYCDEDTSVCIQGVPMMCPQNLTARQRAATKCLTN